jgi:Rps23 Pro-64 3,4-dihydroxylase Tpa1-like proline 4-hydroxylase
MENSTIQQSNNVIHAQDFIVIYRALDKDLCETVIQRFNEDENKNNGKIGRLGDVSVDERIKKSWDLEIPIEGKWQDIFQKIHPKIQTCIAHYVAQSPILTALPLQATGYKIQMYPKNQGYFNWHADSVGIKSRSRVAAMVLYLNDVEQGGETEFYHHGIKISPTAGNLVLFPVGWNYMHRGHVPESGDKYIISTFIKFKD